MDLNTLRYLRGEAMRDFDDGKLPEADAQLAALISQWPKPSDAFIKAEIALCHQDRATVRRCSNRWREALDDIAECETIALQLAPLPRAMMLRSVYFIRALLRSAPDSDVFDASEATAALAELRKYSSGWDADYLDAELAFRQKQWDKAAGLYMAVTRALTRESWMQGIASCQARAGQCFLETGQLQSAEEQLKASLTFLEKSGPPDILAHARLAFARLRARQGEPDEAWDLALQSLADMESLVRHFRDVDEQQRFLADKLQFYGHAFAIAQVKSGADGNWRAWSIAERAKSFYLCHLVANADIALSEGIDGEDLNQLKSLEAQLDGCERSLSPMTPQEKADTRGQELQQQINALSQRKRELLRSIMKQNPRWAALKIPPLFDLKAELAKIDPTWVAVSYFWLKTDADQQLTLHIFWRSHNGDPETAAISWASSEVAVLDRLRNVLQGTVNPGENPFPPGIVAKVLPPELLRSLKNDSKLLISPHDRLKGIPLHAAAIQKEQLLVQKSPVQYIPTLALLSLRPDGRSANKVLLMGCTRDGFGDLPLKAVDTEIEKLSQIWRSQDSACVTDCIIRADQSLADVGLDVEHWNQFGTLHFACHGEFEQGKPFDAALRLGKDAVRASEMFGLRLTKARIFLSACSLGDQQSGSGKPAASDEWIGLYLPLFYARAQELLVSLYDADSNTTMKIMVEAHTCLSRGMGLASALQQAVKAIIDEGYPTALWANWYLVGFPA